MISKKAASEIVVRQALAELDQWDVQARFILNPHKDSKGKDILLVKDFKEILNRVSELHVVKFYVHGTTPAACRLETIRVYCNP